MVPRRTRSVVLLVLVAVPLVVPGPVVTATTASDDVVTVGDGPDADVRTVQSAVDAASPGDTVRVRPGVYRESVVVDVGVTIVAPHGATLDGSTLADDATAFVLRADGVVVDGFTVREYNVGVSADGSDGEWVLRNTTIRNTDWKAVGAGGTGGDWRVRNVSIAGTGTGIEAVSTGGDWRVTDTVVRNVTEGHGVDAATATGAWTLDNVTVRNVDFVGVSASFTGGDWRVQNSTIRGATVGVSALDASGNWTITGGAILGSSVSERYDFWQPSLSEGVGLYARATNGTWAVHHTRFAGNEDAAVSARGSDPVGDATDNRWDGASEPGDETCVGNVECGEGSPGDGPARSSTATPLSSPPRDGGGSASTHTRPSAASRLTTSPDPASPPATGPPDVPSTLLFGVGVLGGALLVGIWRR
jgi:pectinesterase